MVRERSRQRCIAWAVESGVIDGVGRYADGSSEGLYHPPGVDRLGDSGHLCLLRTREQEAEGSGGAGGQAQAARRRRPGNRVGLPITRILPEVESHPPVLLSS